MAVASRPDVGEHLVLYDGDCGLCNRVVQFLLKRDRRGVFVYAPLQSATGRRIVMQAGGNPSDPTAVYAVPNYRTTNPRALRASDAALFVAGKLGWPWAMLSPLRLLPRFARDAVYRLVARHRHGLFSQAKQCTLLPGASDRFIDV